MCFSGTHDVRCSINGQPYIRREFCVLDKSELIPKALDAYDS